MTDTQPPTDKQAEGALINEQNARDQAALDALEETEGALQTAVHNLNLQLSRVQSQITPIRDRLAADAKLSKDDNLGG